jgi:hypothetical protein
MREIIVTACLYTIVSCGDDSRVTAEGDADAVTFGDFDAVGTTPDAEPDASRDADGVLDTGDSVERWDADAVITTEPDVPVESPPCREPGTVSSEGWIDGLLVTENTTNALSFFVEWTSTVAVLSELWADCGPDYRHYFAGGEAALSHRVFVMGLWEGAHCELRVCASAGDDEVASEERSFDVGTPPESVPQLAVLERGGARMQPGWTLFNLSNQPDRIPPQIVLVDEQGRYRWYHQRASRWAGADIDTYLLRDGFLVSGNVGNPRPAIVDFRGEITWEGRFDMHHEIRPNGSEDRLMHLAFTTDCPDGVQSTWIVERDISDGNRILWDWKLCRHYTPDPTFEDWAHTNASAVSRRGGAADLLSKSERPLEAEPRNRGDPVGSRVRGPSRRRISRGFRDR